MMLRRLCLDIAWLLFSAVTSAQNAAIMDTLPQPIVDALQFEKDNWANGPATADPFYTVSPETADARPGTLLKVETDTDSSKYLLPSSTAISRIVYQSETINGSAVPVSACVLWPYAPRKHEGRYLIAAWAHGTSGITADSAPSSHKRIQQHFLAPYQILLQGYVVIATDYAGLGVSKTASGKHIVHEYLASPAQANDVVHSVRAARQAFPVLSEKFVVLGHSQGGGAAWAVAQRQAVTPIPGYLGAVAVSPATRVTDEIGAFLSALAATICPGLASAFPDFKLEDILTSECIDILNTIDQTKSGVSSSIALLMNQDLLKPGWRQNQQLERYQQLISNGGKSICGPLLVIQGEADPQINYAVTTDAVNKTAQAFPSAHIEYVSIPNVSHDPALPASQWLWIDWIADRFASREAKAGLQRSTLSSARPLESYQPEQNWFPEPATQFYQIP